MFLKLFCRNAIDLLVNGVLMFLEKVSNYEFNNSNKVDAFSFIQYVTVLFFNRVDQIAF